MANVAHNAEQEFWRPPIVVSAPEEPARSGPIEACERCATEFMVGARFCHACGALRPISPPSPTSISWTRHLEFHNIQNRLGLSTPSLLAFILGLGCILAAITVGLVFSAQTLVDWQAVQLWRIQWLLAATAAFLASILLKKTSRPS